MKNISETREKIKKTDQANHDALGPPQSHVEELKRSITLRDGHETPAWIIRPKPSPTTKKGPLIVLFHGGGFTMGTEDHMVPYARGLTLIFGAVVVSATYRLAPEHPFPTPALDAYDALQWSGSNAADLGADPSLGFIVGGVSAGGNLACVLPQMAIERGMSPPLTGVWSCVPPLEPHGKMREKWVSRRQNANALILSTRDQDILDSYYAADIKSALYSPLNSEQGLKNYPKSFVQVCGGDPVRDDGLILAKSLQNAGVEIQIKLYSGLPHGFWSGFPQLKSSKRFMLDLTLGLAWMLNASNLDLDVDRVGEVLYIPSH